MEQPWAAGASDNSTSFSMAREGGHFNSTKVTVKGIGSATCIHSSTASQAECGDDNDVKTDARHGCERCLALQSSDCSHASAGEVCMNSCTIHGNSGRNSHRIIIPLALSVASILEQPPNYSPIEVHQHLRNIVFLCQDIGRNLADLLGFILQQCGLQTRRHNNSGGESSGSGDALLLHSDHCHACVDELGKGLSAPSIDKDVEGLAQGAQVSAVMPQDSTTSATGGKEDDDKAIPNRVFVGNIGYRQSWHSVKDFFSKFGKVAFVHMVFDHITKLSRGIAFVEFENAEDTERCLMAEGSDLVMEGRVLRVRRAFESRKTNFRLYPKIPDVDEVKESTDQSSVFGLHNLPHVVWRIVFSYLTLHEQVRLERVCKRWRQIALHQWQCRRRLKCAGFSLMKPMTERTLGSLLQRCSEALVELDLSAAARLLSTYSLIIIGHCCPQLQKLDMSGMNATNMAMRDLSDKTRNLKWIRMHRCLHVGEKGLWWLFKGCQDLEFVDVSENGFVTGKLTDYAALTMAQRCPDLQDLQIQNCSNLTDTALSTIMTMKNLKKLIAGGYFRDATVEPWKQLGNLHNLEYLNVDFNPLISDAALFSLVRGCPHLSYLTLSGCRPRVSDDSISELSKLPCLRYLNVSYLDKVSSSSLVRVAERCPLRSLLICACPNVDDHGVGLILETCRSLRLLDLSGNFQLGNNCLCVYSQTDSSDRSHCVDIVVGGTSILMDDDVLDVPDNFNIIRDNRSSHRLHPDYLVDLPEPLDLEEDQEEDWVANVMEGQFEEEGALVEGQWMRFGARRIIVRQQRINEQMREEEEERDEVEAAAGLRGGERDRAVWERGVVDDVNWVGDWEEDVLDAAEGGVDGHDSLEDVDEEEIPVHGNGDFERQRDWEADNKDAVKRVVNDEVDALDRPAGADLRELQLQDVDQGQGAAGRVAMAAPQAGVDQLPGTGNPPDDILHIDTEAEEEELWESEPVQEPWVGYWAGRRMESGRDAGVGAYPVQGGNGRGYHNRNSRHGNPVPAGHEDSDQDEYDFDDDFDDFLSCDDPQAMERWELS